MYSRGIKASELIKILQNMIKQYGDRNCIAGGNDYPEGVETVYLEKTGDSYISKGSFVIR